MHNHDNLKELNKKNTTLIIDGQEVKIKKFLNPIKTGIYSIKLILKVNCLIAPYIFCQCKHYRHWFFLFNTKNVTDMRMFYDCSSLSSLNLSPFNTEKVTDMEAMFFASKVKIDRLEII